MFHCCIQHLSNTEFLPVFCVLRLSSPCSTAAFSISVTLSSCCEYSVCILCFTIIFPLFHCYIQHLSNTEFLPVFCVLRLSSPCSTAKFSISVTLSSCCEYSVCILCFTIIFPLFHCCIQHLSNTEFLPVFCVLRLSSPCSTAAFSISVTLSSCCEYSVCILCFTIIFPLFHCYIQHLSNTEFLSVFCVLRLSSPCSTATFSISVTLSSCCEYSVCILCFTIIFPLFHC